MTRIKGYLVKLTTFRFQLEENGWDIEYYTDVTFFKKIYIPKIKKYKAVLTLTITDDMLDGERCWIIRDLYFRVWKNGKWEELERDPDALRGVVRKEIKEMIDASR